MKRTCYELSPRSEGEATSSQRRARIRTIVSHRLLVTAFQPICSLASGMMVGVEALTRFVTEDGAGPDYWFPEAARVGLSPDLELAALNLALDAARHLPPHVYVGLHLSPDTCLDPALPALLEGSPLALNRMVLELTERAPVHDYDALIALAPLRSRGLRIAIDDAGSGFASLRHILHLHPDIIKLDRTLIAGINHDISRQALAEALVAFAGRTGAIVIAEGIETQAELEALTSLGMTAGQGYLLGRPTVHPADWALWQSHLSKGPEDKPKALSATGSLTTL